MDPKYSEIDDQEDTIIKWILDEESDWEGSSTSVDSEDSCEADVLDVPERRCYHRITDFIGIIEKYDDQEFKEHFRLKRCTADFLIKKVTNAGIFIKHQSGGRKIISSQKAVLLTIWYLANQETFRQISDRFDMTKSAAYTCINKVVKYLVKIAPEIIKWPAIGIETEAINRKFEEMQGIKNIIGAIDGSHINIRRPVLDPHVYCNRKGAFSILLQGVADSNKMFIDVFCGEAGSIHDSRLLKRSNLYKKCVDGMLTNQGLFLLGDSAYPNLSWLVPPFKDNGHLSKDQHRFNYKHSSSRMVVENAFGLLKGRFRRLQKFDNFQIPFIVEATVAACVLHNICIKFDDLDIDPYFEENGDEDNQNLNSSEHYPNNCDKRQEIFSKMFN